MINDSSITDIIKSLKMTKAHKLVQDQHVMKAKVQTEFKKLSKEGLLVQTVIDVYCIRFFDKKDAPLARFNSYPSLPENAANFILDSMKDFYKESEIISEDGFNLMTYLEYTLNAIDPNFHFWCSYPQISYDILEEADTYDFTLIQFDAHKYKQDLKFRQQVHPFIKSFYYTWISEYKEPTYDNAFRKAACNTNDFMGATWDHLNILSTMKYESSQNNGSLLFVSEDPPHLLLNFETPVPLSDYRQVRKLLQMSRQGHYLIINGDYMAIGFGYVKKQAQVYRIDFVDHLTWKMYLGDDHFLSCTNLMPTLPATDNHLNKLNNLLALTFNAISYDQDLLTQIIETASKQHKGTMIVVSSKAKEEALRLSASSIKIKPTKFVKNQLQLVTSIDGALILDTDGNCHAIGTILDGSATGNGDASRGARYNSALRYCNAQRHAGNPCLIAVISEDRYIDLISSRVDTNYYK